MNTLKARITPLNNEFSIRKPEVPSNLIWSNLEKTPKSFWCGLSLLIGTLMLVFLFYFIGLVFIQTFQSKTFTSENKQNEAITKNCKDHLTIDEIFSEMEALYKWTALNSKLVNPKFFFTPRVIERFDRFSIFPDVDPKTLPQKSEKAYPEFLSKYDDYSKKELCFCHIQYGKEEIEDDRIGELCSIDTSKQSNMILIQMASGALISIINLLFLRLIPGLVYRVPLRSVTSQMSLIIILSVIILYINSVIVPLFIHFQAFPSLFGINYIDIDKSFLSGLIVHLNFDHLWYANVGSKITFSLIFTFLFSTFFEIFKLRLFKK